MSNEKKQIQTEEAVERDPAKDNTDMAVERTIMAADRSQMAWVRTGLSLISFGFTLYKFLDVQRQQLAAMGKPVSEISSPKVVGLLMIGIGILSLVFGTIEYITTTRVYRKRYRFSRPQYSLFIAGIITIIGIVLFVGIVFQFSGIS